MEQITTGKKIENTASNRYDDDVDSADDNDQNNTHRHLPKMFKKTRLNNPTVLIFDSTLFTRFS